MGDHDTGPEAAGRRRKTTMRVRTALAIAPHSSPKKKRPRDVVSKVNDVVKSMGLQFQMSAGVKRRVANVWNEGMDLGGLPSVAYLSSLGNDMSRADPGVIISMSTEGEGNALHHWFVSPSWLKQVMKGCLPVLHLDGTHVHTSHGHHLYLAVVQDAGRHPMVVAYGIAGNESTDNWGAFLHHLEVAFNEELTTRPWTVMSDQGLGLVRALSNTEFWTNIPSALCTVHLERNLASCGLDAIELIKRIARTPAKTEANAMLEKLRRISHKAHHHLTVKVPLESWTISHAPRERFGVVTTNPVEGLNARFLEERKLGLIRMLAAIWDWCHLKVYERHTEAFAAEDGAVFGSINGFIKRHMKTVGEMKGHQAIRTRIPGNPEVDIPGLGKHMLTLAARMCTCGMWQSLGYPCIHASTFFGQTPPENMGEQCDPLYRVAAYRKTYEMVPVIALFLSPMPQPEDIEALPMKAPVGRPRKRRMDWQTAQQFRVKAAVRDIVAEDQRGARVARVRTLPARYRLDG